MTLNNMFIKKMPGFLPLCAGRRFSESFLRPRSRDRKGTRTPRRVERRPESRVSDGFKRLLKARRRRRRHASTAARLPPDGDPTGFKSQYVSPAGTRSSDRFGASTAYLAARTFRRAVSVTIRSAPGVCSFLWTRANSRNSRVSIVVFYTMTPPHPPATAQCSV